ncbi:MAG: hypothetical protein GC202_06545 [Alphaproteobacteria bacterium]|nr:hypothetical protein [Alphaproteobacteria bacterium]
MSISCAVGAWAIVALAMDKADELKFACYPDRRTCVEKLEGLSRQTKRGFNNGLVGCRAEREEDDIVASKPAKLPETAKLDPAR